MIHTLKCPSCAAPLDYNDSDEAQTIHCPFCGNRLAVSEQLRPRQAGPRVTTDGSQTTKKLATFVAVAVALVVCGTLALVWMASRRSQQVSSIPRPTPFTPPVNIAPSAKQSDDQSGFAKVLLKFGSEGIGPGNFKDARSIAVDAEGRIYVGEYIGGRIQVFDASGKFITQWMVDTKMPLRGMAADRRGTVYVVQKGKVLRYEGETGNMVGELMGLGRFDDVAVTADGGLITSAIASSDDIVRFDSSGRNVRTIKAAISGQTDRSELEMRVAADGLGNVYALGTFNNAVFKFSPEGRFLTKFGGDGDEAGQFRAPDAIAVDNQGRVFVSDIKGVQVFDPEGRYLGGFRTDGVASGMVFNDQNELFVAARTQVIKYALGKR